MKKFFDYSVRYFDPDDGSVHSAAGLLFCEEGEKPLNVFNRLYDTYVIIEMTLKEYNAYNWDDEEGDHRDYMNDGSIIEYAHKVVEEDED